MIQYIITESNRRFKWGLNPQTISYKTTASTTDPPSHESQNCLNKVLPFGGNFLFNFPLFSVFCSDLVCLLKTDLSRISPLLVSAGFSTASPGFEYLYYLLGGTTLWGKPLFLWRICPPAPMDQPPLTNNLRRFLVSGPKLYFRAWQFFSK